MVSHTTEAQDLVKDEWMRIEVLKLAVNEKSTEKIAERRCGTWRFLGDGRKGAMLGREGSEICVVFSVSRAKDGRIEGVSGGRRLTGPL